MRFYNYKRAKCQRILILLAFLIVSITVIFYIVLFYIEKMLLVAFEDKAKQRLIEIVEKSIIEVIDEGKISYDDIVKSEQTKNTTLLKIDTVYVNRLVSQWVLSINSKIKSFLPLDIELKLGYLFKNILFNNIGPTFNGRVIYVAALSYDIKSEFYSAGINQTIHRINLIIVVKGDLMFMQRRKDFKLTQKVPIAENIYIGEVPKVYLGK